ncbi:hypothetical protein Pcinc_015396 [Petrolisthes cinctipes]|uniref:Uncharacterized protein n=1 Tax=Petrolisthes cinctipes TaxID=88211 RepID=A0AAE1KQS2_PETCI|nr:hypothetical protein Pcinc_015396 [Petrolisthes cinctipes]
MTLLIQCYSRTSFEYTVIFSEELRSPALQEAYEPLLFVVHCVYPSFHPSTATVQASVVTVCRPRQESQKGQAEN